MPKKIDIILINVLTLLTCFVVIIFSVITYFTIDIIAAFFSKVF